MRERLLKYGLAVALAGSAFLLRQWFTGAFGSTVTYIFLYPAVLATAVLVGVVPGLLATLLAALFAATWIFPPIGRPWPLETSDLLGLGIFTAMSALVCLLTGVYHRSQRRIQALERAQATRETEERFHSLADNIAQLAWMADPSGTRFWFNQRWLDYTGTTLEQMLDQDWQSVHHPDHVQRVVEKINHCFATGEIWEDTFPLRARDGSYRWFLSRAIPIRNAEGQVERWFGTNTDITDLRNAEAALRAAKEAAENASRSKDEFLAIVSHELRTPMTVILGALQHLQLANPPEDQRRKLLEMTDGAAHRLLGIINDLLDITAIVSRKLKIAARPFALEPTVRETAEVFARAAWERGIGFDWQIGPQVPPQVIGDPDRLAQVLTNLLDNAVKFTDRGEVTLRVDITAGALEFAIRDSGIGIAEDQLERIFEPFNQVDSSLTRRHGGTGLGLAICRELVGLMGGSIRVESTAGRGSTFRFTLPLQPVATADPVADPEPVGAPGTGGGKILLADDEPIVRDLVEQVLQRPGWEVICVETGLQALERWQQGGIDLVLMDVQMPEMDGLEATRQIRLLEQPHGKRTRIIALTAHVRPEKQREFLAAGMDGVLTKPFRLEALKALLRTDQPSGD